MADRVLEAIEVDAGDGRVLRAYDTGPGPSLPVVWHHGTPNTGQPPRPLFAAADRLGVRWVGYDRPGYGGSSPRPDRSVGSAAADVATVAEALGLDRFALMGHSGGTPHALASAALLADRVVGVVGLAGLAPYGVQGLDWFADMATSGVDALRASAAGRTAKERWEVEQGDSYDPEFTPGDLETLEGDWSWVLEVVRAGIASGPAPAIDDDLAYVTPWGFDLSAISAPALFVHGGRDRVAPPAHSRWLAEHSPGAELRLVPEAGHVSVLRHAEDALGWLSEHSR